MENNIIKRAVEVRCGSSILSTVVISSFLLTTLLISNVAVANPEVTSREYKLMLDKKQFNFSNETQKVDLFFRQMKSAVEAAIEREVSGEHELAKVREVSFFDTPGSCVLRKNGYSYRDRIDHGESTTSLKFRSPDRYIVGFEDVSSIADGAKSKFELDIGANPTNPFVGVYSASTKQPNSETVMTMGDINRYFTGFASRYDFDDSLVLSQVSDLLVYERVYRGVEIDLGKFDAEVDLTLWYQENPTNGSKPIVAEVSFSYEDKKAEYTRKVVNRAKTAFEAISNMSPWVDVHSQTKTSFVYNYDANFCH
ncbi:hypothetical protein L4D20_18695 [Vibrio kyushuensis]|uniref:hypothetical protein n=1 Tax=Vibrio TaxID=662 RepID=UPI003D0F78B7